MIKKTITFPDYDGNTRTEDFYFDLNEAEIAELNLSVEGGLKQKVERITQTQDRKQLIGIFKEIILMAYGEKTPDGRGFRKSQELIDNFTSTKAYAQLFVELATNAEKASEFINGIVPTNSVLFNGNKDENKLPLRVIEEKN